jgi:hypothetical protein
MNSTSRPKEPQVPAAIHDEADIGSGEKTPAQQETEEIIRQIPPLPGSDTPVDKAKKTHPPQ